MGNQPQGNPIRNGKATLSDSRHYSLSPRHKPLNPAQARLWASSLEVEVFPPPIEALTSPDPPKHTRTAGYAQVYDCQHDPERVQCFGRECDINAPHNPALAVKSEWPPHGYSLRSQFSLSEATRLVSTGSLAFDGWTIQANHTAQYHLRLNADVSVQSAEDAYQKLPKASNVSPGMSLTLDQRKDDSMPWETLEQPSMTHRFGGVPGTITLSHHISPFSQPLPFKAFPQYEVVPRETDSLLVLQRLHFLQGGLDADPGISEQILYTQLIYDPEWQKSVPTDLERQMAVLVAALNSPIWIDFRDPRSQILAHYFDTDDIKKEEYFYQQLLLSLELFLRIQTATKWMDASEEQSVISCIPEKVAWDLALAKIWQKTMLFESLDDNFLRSPTNFRITALAKNIQCERLMAFALIMKCIDIGNVEKMLLETPEGVIPVESKSAHSASWITGAIFPGPSASWLAMKTLLDCDASIANFPQGFDQMYPNLGFQYRNSTFWNSECIVGKVLGAGEGVHESYGWIGPCINSKDLSNMESALIHTEQQVQHMSKGRVKSLAARSAALGPPADHYTADEYVLPLPDFAFPQDTVHIRKLALKRLYQRSPGAQPHTYRAALICAIGNKQFPIRLRNNVKFIYAPACQGTHPLFYDYAYETTTPGKLMENERFTKGIAVGETASASTSFKSDSTASSPTSTSFSDPKSASTSFSSESSSNAQHAPTASNKASASSDSAQSPKHGSSKVSDPESILVIQAFGHTDNEVFTRAWVSHAGYSAIVANTHDTCMACSIRMAYAASVPVVILNDDLARCRARKQVS